MHRPLVITNPNVAANVAITLPDGAVATKIITAQLVDTGDYPAAAAVAPVNLVVVVGVPVAGQIQLSSPSQVTLGNATNDGFQTVFVLIEELGDSPAPTYSGIGVNQQGFGY